MTVSKTTLGSQVMKDRSVHLSAQQRSALILCDGKRSAEEVVRITAAVGVTLQDIDALVGLGLVEIAANAQRSPAQVSAPVAQRSPANAPTAMPSASNPSADAQSSTSEVDFSVALNEAITLCSKLGFKGFGLNMALTGVDSLEKLQKLAPEIRRAAGDAKYKALHEQIFGKSL